MGNAGCVGGAVQPNIQPLLVPRRDTKHSSQRSPTQRLAAIDRLEKQDLLLQVWREIRQVEDLGEARPSEAELPCGIGLILNLPAEDRLPDLVGVCECDGDARGAVLRACRRDGDKPLLSSVPNPMKCAVYDSPASRTHASASWGTLAGRVEGVSPRSTINIFIRLAGSSSSTDWMTARSNRPRF